jgi:hypothetical protein
VVDFGVWGAGQFQQRRCEIGDVHEAANVVCEEDPRCGAGREQVHMCLVYRVPVSDDERGPRDSGGRARPVIAVLTAPYGVMGSGRDVSL